MISNQLFTLNLDAAQSYEFTNESSANGGVLVNDAGSAGQIFIQGTANIVVNGNVTSSQPIPVTAGQFIVFGAITPLSFTITTDAATTGKLMLSV